MTDADIYLQVREKHDGAMTERPDVRVWLRMLSLSTIVEKRLRGRFISQFDTTLPRFDVMASLERHPDGISLGELSRALLVSNGNVTPLIRQLELDGLVATRPAVEDRRSSIAVLTPKGRAHFADLAAAHHAWIHGMFDGMSEDELLALYQLLGKLKVSISSEVKDD